MGADIHVVLGLIKTPIIDKSVTTVEITTDGLEIFNSPKLNYDYFTLSELPEELDITRDYNLFSRLAAVRGRIKPKCDINNLRTRTNAFLSWLDNEYACRTAV